MDEQKLNDQLEVQQGLLNATEYKPTPREEKLLEALLDPHNRMKTIADVCRIAECDRATYYRAFDKPGFVDLYSRKSTELAKKYLGQVMNSFVKEATRGSFQHGKVLLEMAGAYNEKQIIDARVKTDNSPIDLSALSEEELRQFEQLLSKAQGTVKDSD